MMKYWWQIRAKTIWERFHLVKKIVMKLLRFFTRQYGSDFNNNHFGPKNEVVLMLSMFNLRYRLVANLTQNHFIWELVKIIEKFEFLVKGNSLRKFLKVSKVASNRYMKIGIHRNKSLTKSISQINHFTSRGQALMYWIYENLV